MRGTHLNDPTTYKSGGQEIVQVFYFLVNLCSFFMILRLPHSDVKPKKKKKHNSSFPGSMSTHRLQITRKSVK